MLDLPLPEFPTEPALEGRLRCKAAPPLFVPLLFLLSHISRYAYVPACIVFDAVAEQWTTDGLWRQISDSLPAACLRECRFLFQQGKTGEDVAFMCNRFSEPREPSSVAADPSAAELIAATVVYRQELVPVEEEPPSVVLIIGGVRAMRLVSCPSLHRDIPASCHHRVLAVYGRAGLCKYEEVRGGRRTRPVGEKLRICSRMAVTRTDAQATPDVEAAVSSRVAPAPESE